MRRGRELDVALSGPIQTIFVGILIVHFRERERERESLSPLQYQLGALNYQKSIDPERNRIVSLKVK